MGENILELLVKFINIEYIELFISFDWFNRMNWKIKILNLCLFFLFLNLKNEEKFL